MIDTTGEIEITTQGGQTLPMTNTMKTGDKILVTFSDYQQHIILSIKGDVTGKGLWNQDDVLKSYSALRQEITLDRIYFLAADLNKDGHLKINDIAKLYQYTQNKIESLED